MHEMMFKHCSYPALSLQAVHEVSTCRRLKTLILTDNGISNLVGIECLAELNTLKLENNAVDSMLQLRPLSIIPRLNSLAIAGNPVSVRQGSPQHLRSMLRNLIPGLPFMSTSHAEYQKYTNAAVVLSLLQFYVAVLYQYD